MALDGSFCDIDGANCSTSYVNLSSFYVSVHLQKCSVLWNHLINTLLSQSWGNRHRAYRRHLWFWRRSGVVVQHVRFHVLPSIFFASPASAFFVDVCGNVSCFNIILLFTKCYALQACLPPRRKSMISRLGYYQGDDLCITLTDALCVCRCMDEHHIKAGETDPCVSG